MADINCYDVGDAVIITIACAIAGQPFNPTTVTFEMIDPDGVTTNFTYPASIQQPVSGSFSVYWKFYKPGYHNYNWTGSTPGIYDQAVTRTMLVKSTVFT